MVQRHLHAGELKWRIELCEMSESKQADGSVQMTPSVYATVYAAKVDQRGDEDYIGAQRQAERTTTWRIRWRDDVDETHVIKYYGKEYDIVYIGELGYRQALEIDTVLRK